MTIRGGWGALADQLIVVALNLLAGNGSQGLVAEHGEKVGFEFRFIAVCAAFADSGMRDIVIIDEASKGHPLFGLIGVLGVNAFRQQSPMLESERAGISDI
ncbi:hypothetical protein D3C84_1132900 [compost metagenome]